MTQQHNQNEQFNLTDEELQAVDGGKKGGAIEASVYMNGSPISTFSNGKIPFKVTPSSPRIHPGSNGQTVPLPQGLSGVHAEINQINRKIGIDMPKMPGFS